VDATVAEAIPIVALPSVFFRKYSDGETPVKVVEFVPPPHVPEDERVTVVSTSDLLEQLASAQACTDTEAA
jgi:hypothetical protein